MALQLFDDSIFDEAIFDTGGQDGLTPIQARRLRNRKRPDYIDPKRYHTSRQYKGR